MQPAILLVDDEAPFLESMVRLLRLEGLTDVASCSDPLRALDAATERTFDAAFLDVTMPGMDGLDLLARIKEISPSTECVMVTAHDSVSMAVRAMRLGAYDYLVKPVTPAVVRQVLDRALERRRLLASLMIKSGEAALGALRNPEAFKGFATMNAKLLRLLHEAELHAASAIPVLITGETGVGKELMARAIHLCSRRAEGPFVAVNMLALTPTLFESEFFGHIKGAFTGAERDKPGYLAQARGGTLFLDEIGDLPLEVQGKLLRFLQEGEYTPVGRTRAEPADVRFIAASNQDMRKQVAEGRFRKDLFFRLQYAHLHLPPLLEHLDDLPLLAARILEPTGKRLSPQAEQALYRHDWPGNVRELKGVLEAASNLAEKGVIEPAHLAIPHADAPLNDAPAGVALESLEAVERRHILHVYQGVGRNKSQCARILDIGLQTLHRKLKSYGEP